MPGCTTQFILCVARLVCEISPNVSFNEAAGFVTICTTTDEALSMAASTMHSTSSSLLVHAGSGGIGLTALNWAERANCRTLCTAGSSTKRVFLRSLGSSFAVASTRETHFATDFLRGNLALEALDQSRGQSIGSVLNSLTSPGMVSASLSALSCGGSFLEIGKRNIWSTQAVKQERRDVYSATVALDYAPLSVSEHLLHRLSILSATDTMQPITNISFTHGNISRAVRMMTRAVHIGKVVVSMSDENPDDTPKRLTSTTVVGGLGAIGATVAAWSAERGSPSLRLLGRSGRSLDTRVQQCLPASPVNSGLYGSTAVDLVRCDVASAEEASLVARVTREGP